MLVKFYFLFIVILLCNTINLNESAHIGTGSTEFRSDYTYHAQANGWFKIHPVPLDWQTARLICHYEGAELASPTSPEMLDTINELVANSEPKLEKYFSGVHQTFGDGVYTSIEGIPFEKLHIPNWGIEEPNGYGDNQKCLVYYKDGIVGSNNCLEHLPYICFRRFSKTDQLTECGTVDKGYQIDARTGHCYKFHKHADIWERAHKICQAEGGYLAVINNNAEAEVLSDIFIRSQTPKYTPFVNTVAIGFREWGQASSWWTIHGQTLEEAGFEQWGNGLPDNFPYPEHNKFGRQSCGGFRKGELDDIWCDVPFAFICEKTKDSLTNTTGGI